MRKYIGYFLIIITIFAFVAIYFSVNDTEGGRISSSSTEEVKSLIMNANSTLNSLNSGELVMLQGVAYVDVTKAYASTEILTNSLEKYYSKEVVTLILERLDPREQNNKLLVRQNIFGDMGPSDFSLELVGEQGSSQEYELQYYNHAEQLEYVSFSTIRSSNGLKLDTIPN